MKLEYLVFVAGTVLLIGLQQLLLYRSYRQTIKKHKEQHKRGDFFCYITALLLLFLFCSLYGGWFFVQYGENKVKQQMKNIMDGVAPTFAYELHRMGHAAIDLDTPGDDLIYVEMINTMVDWMKINPLIQSIYTFRQTTQGDVVFILGPETDYDRNGLIEGEKEERVPAGTAYKEVVPEMIEAFQGRYSFQEEPEKDQWSYCVSVYMPIYGKNANIPEAILGIDFDGTSWNEAMRLERLKAIGLLLGFLIMVNALYLALCQYWFNLQKNRQQELDREIAHLDRMNLIGEIAAAIGHEVRNPMTTVRGFLQLFQREQQCEKHQELLALMIEELDRANSIISEFLSLAKNKIVNFKLASLNDLLQTIKPILQSEVLLKGHNLVMNLDHVPNFLIDTNEIRQLILNIFRNGLEAMPKSGTITISTFSQNDQAYLVISDEGEGIAQQVLSNLGAPFVTTKESGTGLGLAVCYRIARHHQAKIDVTTGAGGTTFTVMFPLG